MQYNLNITQYRRIQLITTNSEQHRISHDEITRNVHGEFNCIKVNFERIYKDGSCAIPVSTVV